MVSFGSPEVREASVSDVDMSSVELPSDNSAIFEEVRNDPDVDTADMRVQGDWTYGTIADRISMEERVNNNKIQWSAFKQVQWDNYSTNEASNVNISADERSKVFTGSPSVSVNDLVPGQDTSAFIDLGQPAPGPQAAFAAGDPGLGVPSTDDYIMDGRADTSSAVVYDGDVILDAEEATRAVAYNPPGDAEVMQMVNRYDWGHQARAVMESMPQAPGLGTSESFKAPSFDTRGPQISLVSPYSYNYNRVAGLTLLQSEFNIKPKQSTSFTFTLRTNDGEALTSQSLDVDKSGQTASIGFLNAPSSGFVEVDSGGVGYTIDESSKFPPL